MDISNSTESFSLNNKTWILIGFVITVFTLVNYLIKSIKAVRYLIKAAAKDPPRTKAYFTVVIPYLIISVVAPIVFILLSWHWTGIWFWVLQVISWCLFLSFIALIFMIRKAFHISKEINNQ